MANTFDIVLDECIDRIVLRNETVEQCLARYPEHSAALEPLLRAVLTAALAASVPVSMEAKARGRQRLAAERQALRASGRQGGRNVWLDKLPLWTTRLQWVTAAAFALFVVAGGAGTVAAASGTLPGDALYPVKRATEQVRVAFESSDVKKAELRVAYAERRADEISTLIGRGETRHVEETPRDLNAELAAAAKIASAIENPQAVEGLQVALQHSASRALQKIQVAMAEAPKEKREAAAQAVHSSGESYSAAVDAVQAKVPAPSRTAVASQTGKVQFRVTDAALSNVDGLLVTIGRIEVRPGGQRANGWVVVSDTPQTFDLAKLQGSHQFLVESGLSAGGYTSIRVTIESAKVNVNGFHQPVSIGDERVVLQRPFTIAADKTTVVLLDFGGAASLRESSNGRYRLNPKVTVLALEPGVDALPTPEGPSRGSSKTSDPEKDTRVFTATQVVMQGEVQALDETSLTVKGKRISLTDKTVVIGELRVGGRALVQAQASADGSLVAQHVTAGVAASPTPVSTATPSSITLEGRIEAVGEGQIRVDDKTVTITESTEVRGVPVVGAEVKVTGTPTGRDTVQATRVVVESEDPRPAPRPQVVTLVGVISGLDDDHVTVEGYTVTVTTETEVHGTLAIGARVVVIGVEEGESKVVVARRIAVVSTPAPTRTPDMPSPTPVAPFGTVPPVEPSNVRLEGILQSIDVNGLWVVDGQVVRISARTRIDGVPVPGMRVRVEGLRQRDGYVLASRVVVLTVVGPPVPSPSVTPTATESPQETPTATPPLTPTPRASSTEVRPGRVVFEGVVEEQGREEWRVSGRIVRVKDALVVGAPVVGSKVRVTGTANRRGEVKADAIVAL